MSISYSFNPPTQTYANTDPPDTTTASLKKLLKAILERLDAIEKALQEILNEDIEEEEIDPY